MFYAEKTRDLLVDWLREVVQYANAKGVIFGLSGGLDSAVVSGIAKLAFPKTSLGVIMPIHSNPEDKEDALLVAKSVGLETKEVDLKDAFDYIIATTNVDIHSMAAHNLKPRLRASTLSLIGQSKGYLVCGCSNASEWYTGYFTKYGDSAADLLPIARLVKSEVYELAKILGIPDKILLKIPTAGLWQGQTDEDELGVSYSSIDSYILTGIANEEDISKLQTLYKKSAHKRQMPPMGPVVRD